MAGLGCRIRQDRATASVHLRTPTSKMDPVRPSTRAHMAKVPTDCSLPDFRAIFEGVPELYLVLSPDLLIVAASEAYLLATMTRREDVVGRYMFDVFPDNPDEADATGVKNLGQSFDKVLRSRAPHFMAVQKYDIRQPKDQGAGFEERYWSPANFPVLDDQGRVNYLIHRVADITDFVRLKRSSLETQERLERDLYLRAQEVERSNHLLRQSLLDKETLLREIHHRVKNNLQVIASLLRLQARQVNDSTAHAALSDMGNRIRAIADIHQILYSSPDLASVDMSEFASQLVKNLLSVYQIDYERVRVQLKISTSSLEIGRAVPYGLMLNELISNGLKHAFPDGRKGTVVVVLDEPGEVLTVSDDGIGLPIAIDAAVKGSLGLQLVHLLAEQIGAQVRVESRGGTRVTVSTPSK